MTSVSPIWLAALAVTLQDGARLRRVEPLPEVVDGLQAVRWSDVQSGRAATAYVGRRAIVRLDAEMEGVRRVRSLIPALGYWLVESERDEDGVQLAARLQAAAHEAWPDLYFRRRREGFPNDPQFPGQWFFAKIGMEDAWRIETGNVTIAVIDNGCDLQHPDLAAKLDPGRDAIHATGDPSFVPNVNGNYHGTACAGLVGASTNNGLGVAGACPGCRLRCVKLLDDTGSGLVPISADMDAFQFVLDSNAAVASNSWGFTQATPVPRPLADAIQLVHDQGRNGLGTIVVFAAGNDDRLLGSDELEALPGVTTVGAVNNFGEAAQFSNFGPSVAVVAPTGTLSTDISGPDGEDPGDYIGSFGGTSSACPIVAGIFGLMVSLAPNRPASELEDILKATAKQSTFATPDAMGHDDYYGYGLVQPATALKMLQPKPTAGGCGCSVGGAPRSEALGAAVLIAVAAWQWRRRSRARA
jgi:MYXO-CTERM domain-containing protein